MNPNRHPLLRLLSRFGDAARGSIFILIGVLAAEAAISLRGRPSGAIGALQGVLTKPHGRTAVALIAAGLFADAVFRFAQAGLLRSHGLIRRISYGLRGAGALVFGLAVGRMLLPPAARPREGRLFRAWTARLLAQDWGRKAVLAAGILLFLAGAREFVLAASGRKRKAKAAATRLSRIGRVAHGIVLGVVGIFAARAAMDVDPAELIETGGALRVLGRLPYGAAWLFAAAAGLIAYGLSLWAGASER